MRHLNKIVFINSAKTALAEIELAGNVHFIGTQGVGKSTLLRAILFFYNADKTKLGIDPGQTSFDAYYFPADNSYIVYEVTHEHGPFCVLALRSQGRTAFRFIRGTYERSHFIDAENKALTWEGIRKNLDRKGAINRQVVKYEEYRDILYGNNAALPPEFRKYALLESRQYQNIPRTIQNVFLNSKLDAEFIKQTLIMSLNEEDFKLNLNKYAAHLKTFEAHLEDLRQWSEKREENSGQATPRLAQTIVDTALQWRSIGELWQDLLAQITAVYWQIQKELPLLHNQQREAHTQQAQEEQKLREQEAYFRKRKETIDRELHEADYKLETVRKKVAFYAEKNIDAVLTRAAQRESLEAEQQRFLDEKSLLTAKFEDLTQKYEALIAKAQEQLRTFGLQQQNQALEIKHAALQESQRIREEHQQGQEQVKTAFAERLENARTAESQQRQEWQEAQFRKKEIHLRQPLAEELATQKDALTSLRTEIQTLKTSDADSRNQMQHLSQQWQLEVKSAEADAAQKQRELSADFQKMEGQISAVEEKMRQLETSFYNWLAHHKPGWEATIGRVVDETEILFSPSLSPRISGNESADFFGVSIDLNALSRAVKTPADYEAELARLQALKARTEADLKAIQEQLADRKESLKRKFARPISELKEVGKKNTYTLEQLEARRQKATTDLEDLQRKAVAEKKRLLEEATAAVNAAAQALEDASGNLLAIREEEKQALAMLERQRDRKLKEQKTSLQTALAELDVVLRGQEAETAARIAEIKFRQSGALREAGADEARITAIDAQMEAVRQKLQRIADEATLVSDYHKDRREWIDNAAAYRAEKKAAEQKLLTETERITQRRAVQQQVINNLKARIRTLEDTRKNYDEDLKAAEIFQLSEDGFSWNTLADTPPVISGKRLRDLCADAREARYKSERLQNDLRQYSTDFAGRFSTENIFGFPTTFADEEAYLRFADNLKEFLEEDKIQVFESQTNTRYAELIRLIGKEVSDLMSKEGEIQGIITKINRDFKERAFAGVIKSIELRLSASKNPLVQLLVEIKNFNDVNSLNLGGLNLFSTTAPDASNKKAVLLLRSFARQIEAYKATEIALSDSFELEFRIVENDNDSQWVERLSKVGSEGTDVLVKAMINIMLLNVFKENASRNRFRDFRLHCMMDEIGKLHPSNVKGILKFANDRNILLINSSPTSYNAADYRYTYLLSKDAAHRTVVKRLVAKTDAE